MFVRIVACTKAAGSPNPPVLETKKKDEDAKPALSIPTVANSASQIAEKIEATPYQIVEKDQTNSSQITEIDQKTESNKKISPAATIDKGDDVPVEEDFLSKV